MWVALTRSSENVEIFFFFLLNILQYLKYKSVLIKVIITIEHVQHSSFVLGNPIIFTFIVYFSIAEIGMED